MLLPAAKAKEYFEEHVFHQFNAVVTNTKHLPCSQMTGEEHREGLGELTWEAQGRPTAHSLLLLILLLATAPFLHTSGQTGSTKDVNSPPSPFYRARAAKAGTAIPVLLGKQPRLVKSPAAEGREWPLRGNVNPLLAPISPTHKQYFIAREPSCSSFLLS